MNETPKRYVVKTNFVKHGNRNFLVSYEVKDTMGALQFPHCQDADRYGEGLRAVQEEVDRLNKQWEEKVK